MNIETITKIEFVSIIETKLQVIKTSGRSVMQGTNGHSLSAGGRRMGGRSFQATQLSAAWEQRDADPDLKENKAMSLSCGPELVFWSSNLLLASTQRE